MSREEIEKKTELAGGSSHPSEGLQRIVHGVCFWGGWSLEERYTSPPKTHFWMDMKVNPDEEYHGPR